MQKNNNKNKKLPLTFYAQPTELVAQQLLGKKLVLKTKQGMLSGIIVETEAYTKNDPASHAYRGKTARTSALFGPVGHAYIYFIYGNHYCLNVVAHTPEQIAGGILIRAIEPIDGIEVMRKKRKTSDKNLTNGPGKLCQAFGITKTLYGKSFSSPDFFLTEGYSVDPEDIVATKRIGISAAQDKLWRFYIKNNQFVSRK